MLKSTLALLIAATCLTGCEQRKPIPQASEAVPAGVQYEISKNGIVEETNKREYETLGDTTFLRTQKYTVKYLGSDPEKPHMLFLRVVVRVGQKDANDSKEAVLVTNGLGELSCAHAYDVKTVNLDNTPDPVCTITSLGDVELRSAPVAVH